MRKRDVLRKVDAEIAHRAAVDRARRQEKLEAERLEAQREARRRETVLERQYRLHPFWKSIDASYEWVRCERLTGAIGDLTRSISKHVWDGDRSDQWVGARMRWRRILMEAYYATPGSVQLYPEDYGI